jgi:hypothetical protein
MRRACGTQECQGLFERRVPASGECSSTSMGKRLGSSGERMGVGVGERPPSTRLPGVQQNQANGSKGSKSKMGLLAGRYRGMGASNYGHCPPKRTRQPNSWQGRIRRSHKRLHPTRLLSALTWK